MEVNLDLETMKKVLGMWWDLKIDLNLSLNKDNKEVLNGTRKPIKREILQILMSAYAPLGLLAFFFILRKNFFPKNMQK